LQSGLGRVAGFVALLAVPPRGADNLCDELQILLIPPLRQLSTVFIDEHHRRGGGGGGEVFLLPPSAPAARGAAARLVTILELSVSDGTGELYSIGKRQRVELTLRRLAKEKVHHSLIAE
jgi:hypothetical protein